MNKRIKKKKDFKDKKEIMYIKLDVNKTLDLCPTLKFKSWKKFMKAGKYYSSKYKCDIWFSVTRWNNKVDENI